MAKLDVQVVISPLPSEIDVKELDRLFHGEVQKFEQWIVANQRRRGHPSPQGLINAERAIVQSYLMYLHSKG